MNATIPLSNLLPPRMRCSIELPKTKRKTGIIFLFAQRLARNNAPFLKLLSAMMRAVSDTPVCSVEQLQLDALVAFIDNAAERPQWKHLPRG